MCGIAGIWRSKKSDRLELEIKQMTDEIIHRGPDGEGHWTDTEIGLALGHRRLAIIDLTEQGHQPMHYLNRYVLTFNGEIYNYVELRSELKKQGLTFQSDSDSEVLLAAYHVWGKECVTRFDGMFSFALYDKTTHELFCARDRFGQKPFFYSTLNDDFLFGSEIKQLLKIQGSRGIEQQMLYLYLNYDVVENPNNKAQTFYSEISQLPAAHCLLVKRGKLLKKWQYWDIDLSKKSTHSLSESREVFKELFSQSVILRMRSDVRVGSSLSGGVDSSSIVGMVKTCYPDRPFHTFTARFNDPNYDEGHFVEIMREKYALETHFCYPSSTQLIDELDRVFWHQDEPFGSTSIVAQWEVMKLAKTHDTTVLLDGQGADEAFGGYFKYFVPFLTELYHTDKKAFKTQLSAIENHLDQRPFFGKREMLRTRFPKSFDYLSDKTRSIRKRSSVDLSDAFTTQFLTEPTPFHRSTTLNEFLKNDLFMYGLGKLLRFSDRNAMAHSREVRLPYLSHHLVEYVFSLPTAQKINNGWTKSILRESMREIVPDEILYRKDKKGFQAPNSWMELPAVLALIDHSSDHLKQEGIIKNSVKENHWKYIMTSKLLENG